MSCVYFKECSITCNTLHMVCNGISLTLQIIIITLWCIKKILFCKIKNKTRKQCKLCGNGNHSSLHMNVLNILWRSINIYISLVSFSFGMRIGPDYYCYYYNKYKAKHE